MSIQINRTGTWQEVPRQEFFELVRDGAIQPDTEVIINDQKVVAAKVSGLVFPSNPQESSTYVQVDEPVKIVAIPSVIGSGSPQLSRAVFIFLAVFVGIFGVHDFYAKRVQYGLIHLSLLLPWILTFIVSVLIVFGYSLCVWCYMTYCKEIRECQIAIKACGKEIKETEQKLAEAMAGKLRKPEEVATRQDSPREVIPQQNEPRVREIVPRSPVDIDPELVQGLESLLDELKQQQAALQFTLDGLKIKQGAERLSVWISPAPLWLYFFFSVLPIVSWVMAMVEIVYVTKDGTGREFCF